MLKERVKALCISRHITVAKLEAELGFGGGTIARWDKSSPKVETLEKVADYFGVTTDFLIGRNTLPASETAVDLDHSAIDKALSLFEQMDEQQQKTAIRLLKALAEENKE